MGKQTKGGVPTVARPRSPNRDAAKIMWLESGGQKTTKELAEAAGVPEVRIRKWKSEDKWQEELDRKKPGGQRGNRNAAGHGAPMGNTNAVTHGAYAAIHLENLTPEERAYIETITIDSEAAMLRELQLLTAKERDLARKIKEYEKAAPDSLYVDRVVEMHVPKDKESDGGSEEQEGLKTTMKTVMMSSPFERLLKLGAEHNKTHGRIHYLGLSFLQFLQRTYEFEFVVPHFGQVQVFVITSPPFI